MKQSSVLLLFCCAWLKAADSFTITSGLNPHQVLQRSKDGTVRVHLTGTALADGQIEARVSNGPFANLAKIKAGSWTADGPTLKTGGPYTVEIRFTPTNGGRHVEKVEDVFVGDIYILSGQSNMVGRARMEGPETPHSKVKSFTPAGKWEEAKEPLHELTKGLNDVLRGTGLGLPFAKEMVRRTGVPIGLVPCAKGGTSIAQWDPALKSEGRKSLYGNMLARFQDVGGKAAGVLWYQGEADAKPELSSIYADKFQKFVAQVRDDFGQPGLPFYYAQIGRYASEMEPAYEGWNQVQEAQRLSEALIPNSGMVATIDLELDDWIHANRPSLQMLGLRFAKLVLDGAKPRFAAARWDNPHQIGIQFQGLSGKLLSSGGRTLGFSLVDENKKPLKLIYRAWIDSASNSVVLNLNHQKPIPDQVYVWYGMGLDPICNLTDESGLAIPTFGPIQVKR